jgi:hypothetical protein
MGAQLMDIFMAKHRILCLTRLALAYIATNAEVAYLSQLLAFDTPRECEDFLNGLGCKIIINGEDGKKKLLCKDSLIALKKAPLKVKESAKTKALTGGNNKSGSGANHTSSFINAGGSTV